MTVIVMSKYDGSYYLTSDGRTTQDWAGIASDETQKVFAGNNCAYGICGNASAKTVIHELLRKSTKPIDVLRHARHESFKGLLKDCSVLVATKKHGCYTLNINAANPFQPEDRLSIIPWSDEQLPQVAGSGFLNVRTALGVIKDQEGEDNNTNHQHPDSIVWAITQSYKDNHTIGGRVSQVELQLTKAKKGSKVKKNTRRKKK